MGGDIYEGRLGDIWGWFGRGGYIGGEVGDIRGGFGRGGFMGGYI